MCEYHKFGGLFNASTGKSCTTDANLPYLCSVDSIEASLKPNGGHQRRQGPGFLDDNQKDKKYTRFIPNAGSRHLLRKAT